MTSGNKWREEKRARRYLTPLNIATSARYDACVANGGHIRSDERVVRDDSGIIREIRLCARCGVPILTLKGWGSPAPAQRGGTRG